MDFGGPRHECADGAHGDFHTISLAVEVDGSLVGIELKEPVVVIGALVSRVDLEPGFFIAGDNQVSQCGLEFFVLAFGTGELCDE